MFVDKVVLTVQAGRGGDGAVAWRREKFIRKGGPCGGDGGRGGTIWIEADPQLPSLESYRNRRIIRAQNGQPGRGGLQSGKSGADLTLKVPVGTLAKDAQTGQLLCDLVEPGQRWRACGGGKGGRGNASFRNATHQTPFEATPGAMGQLLALELELKLIADVGLVGLPNAGKSTLLTQLAGAPARIGAYPFTTLRPNLGAIQWGDQRLLIADIPGIIDGAHRDKGLGLAFLRHIERTRLLIYLIDISGFEGRDPWQDWLTLRSELAAYNPELLHKPSLVVLNKIDVEGASNNAAAFRMKFNEPIPVVLISAQRRQGLEQLEQQICDAAAPMLQDRESQPVEQL
jgi:GTPase